MLNRPDTPKTDDLDALVRDMEAFALEHRNSEMSLEKLNQHHLEIAGRVFSIQYTHQKLGGDKFVKHLSIYSMDGVVASDELIERIVSAFGLKEPLMKIPSIHGPRCKQFIQM